MWFGLTARHGFTWSLLLAIYSQGRYRNTPQLSASTVVTDACGPSPAPLAAFDATMHMAYASITLAFLTAQSSQSEMTAARAARYGNSPGFSEATRESPLGRMEMDLSRTGAMAHANPPR